MAFQKTLSVLVALMALTTGLASANLSPREEIYLDNSFRYHGDTMIEVRFLGTEQEPGSCNGQVCLCNARYKVLRLYETPAKLSSLMKNDTVMLPYQCVGARPLTPYSPYQWGSRLSNGHVLMDTHSYLMENVGQNQWIFGRNRGFIPVFPEHSKIR